MLFVMAVRYLSWPASARSGRSSKRFDDRPGQGVRDRDEEVAVGPVSAKRFDGMRT
ncbi:hypothetical protein [Micromonospora sagamiensis]|uniref:hypothetical protein n=1 Tax=Micromonospora sagamiensis TaxID=47875 RepID=UPI00164408A3|nr:hypothetical protein [Micromonospora sagamiensis]